MVGLPPSSGEALRAVQAPHGHAGRSARRRCTTAELAALLAVLASPWLFGCSDADAGTVIPPPTQIVVDPNRFLGDVACSSYEGAMHSYVVTLLLWDSETDITSFTLGSSYPTPCSRVVSFQGVVTPGLLYTAEIDAYDVFAEELAPFGISSSGAREMHDVETGDIVAPRWTTRCGTGPSQATMAQLYEAHGIEHCEPLVDSAPSVTAIAFPPAAALGSDACATADSLDIMPEGSGLPDVLDVPCDAEPVVFHTDIVDGRGYSFYATADAEGLPLGTECFVTARAGVTVTPLCNAIRDTGDIRLSLAGLTSGQDEICPAGHRFDVMLDDEILNAVPLGCEAVALIGPLSPSDYTLEVLVVDAAGQPYGTGASCTATVVAGRAARATCTS